MLPLKHLDDWIPWITFGDSINPNYFTLYKHEIVESHWVLKWVIHTRHINLTLIQVCNSV